MTLDEIKELAGHREVSPWVVKLVQDAVELERESCAKDCERVAEEEEDASPNKNYDEIAYGCAAVIRERGKL